jgi:hypothetical protein
MSGAAAALQADSANRGSPTLDRNSEPCAREPPFLDANARLCTTRKEGTS